MFVLRAYFLVLRLALIKRVGLGRLLRIRHDLRRLRTEASTQVLP